MIVGLFVANFLLMVYGIWSYIKMRNFRLIEKKINIYYNGELHLSKWDIDAVVSTHFANKLVDEYKKAKNDLISQTMNHAVNIRLEEISKEIAEKYTTDHFEEELRKVMSTRIGDEMHQSLINYAGGRNEY